VILQNGINVPIAPQAFAETTPQFIAGNFVPRTGLPLETAFATYAQLYKSQPWVATVVNKISNLIARLGVNVWDESAPETGKVLDLVGPYAKLMASPCNILDPYSFWLWLASTIEIYGEAYLIKQRGNNRQVTNLLPMHPALTQIHRDDEGNLVYRFMGQPNELIAEDDVVPFRMYDPEGTMRGHSRLEPLRSTLMNEDSARRATSAWWKNMGRPSMILSTDKVLGKDGRERVRDSFTSAHSGSTNAGSVVVFEDGMTATPTQLSSEEMQYIESRKLNREEVCAVYDIPPTAVHILDNATYSNITEQMRSVYRDSMAPRIEFLESVLNWHIGSEFNKNKNVKFAVAEVLRGDFEARATSVSQLVQNGIMKPSEARPLFDLGDEGEVANKLYANSAIQELGKPAERIALSGDVTSTPDDVPVADAPAGAAPSPGAQKYIRTIGGYIGRGRSIQDAARTLLAAHPDDETAIAEACAHIIERKVA
jgi:HK97 family phage portal protein